MVYSLNGLEHNEIIWPSTKYFTHNKYTTGLIHLLCSFLCRAQLSYQISTTCLQKVTLLGGEKI